MQTVYDLCILGGGIHGAGIARDAAGRGLSVLLAERGDLGDGASSQGLGLLQGGLRDLEQRRFRQVREALAERETLLRMAPHIVRPLRLVLPDDRDGGRPWWRLRLGLDLYGSLNRKGRLPVPTVLRLRETPEGRPLDGRFRRGLAYSDGATDAARLVILNARSAADLGARVLVRTAVVRARREEGLWRISLRDEHRNGRDVKARALVNAAGAWTDRVFAEVLERPPRRRLRLVRGSHIVVPVLYQGDQAYALQQKDRGLVFVLPFADGFSLIGTAYAAHEDTPDEARPSPDDIRALCGAASRDFGRTTVPGDVRRAFAELWPAADDDPTDLSAMNREAVIEVEGERVEAPLLSVYGGTMTLYRRTAEAILDKLKPWFPKVKPAWTAGAALPGGDFPDADLSRFLRGLRQRRPWLPPALSLRYARTYGTRTDALLEGARSMDDLGRSFGAGLTEREVAWLREREWAASAEDVLWRRTRLGLHMTTEQRQDLALWMMQAEVAQPV